MKKQSTSLLASIGHAFDGIIHVLVNERNARYHLLAATLVVIIAFWLQLELTAWALLLIAIGLVFTAEMVNTVAELLIDMVIQHEHPTAKIVKDVAAGVVLLMSLVAAAVGIVVMGPPLLRKLSMLLSG